MNYIPFYILCIFATSNILAAWFNTSFANHIFNDETSSFDELMDKVDKRHPFLADLLSCPICLGTWISGAIATILVLINDFSPWFILACQVSVPMLSTRLAKL